MKNYYTKEEYLESFIFQFSSGCFTGAVNAIVMLNDNMQHNIAFTSSEFVNEFDAQGNSIATNTAFTTQWHTTDETDIQNSLGVYNGYQNALSQFAGDLLSSAYYFATQNNQTPCSGLASDGRSIDGNIYMNGTNEPNKLTPYSNSPSILHHRTA